MAKLIIDNDYIIFEGRIKTLINLDNIDRLSKRNIDKIKLHTDNKEFFDIYIDRLINEYKKNKYKTSNSYLRRYIRVVKKLDIPINRTNDPYLNMVRARLLSETRNLKRITYSFEGEDNKRICNSF